MPWNCLCATKEKRKLEISAPILNIEDTSNLQLVPLKQSPFVVPAGSYKFDTQQKPAVNRRHSDAKKNGRLNANEQGYGSLDRKTSRWKRTNSKKLNNSPSKIKGAAGRGAKVGEKENPKVTKQLANVKFSFEAPEDEPDGQQPACRDEVQQCICSAPPGDDAPAAPEDAKNAAVDPEINENVNKVEGEQVKNENAGNYDEIPLIRPETNPEGPDAATLSSTEAPAALRLGKSNDSIPFIDDESSKPPRTETDRENDHEARFITLQPRNIGSPHSTPELFRNEQAEKYLQTISEQKLEDPEEKLEELLTPHPVEHDFQQWKAQKGRICQVCHESLLVRPSCVVKCQSCELVCHSWCTTSVPSIRYHDTSFIIFRKWFKGREELAFPSIHKCITSIRPSSVKVDHHLTDTECNCSEGNKDEAVRKNRRRTKSLEKRKRPEDLPLRFSDKTNESGDDQNNNALRHETIKLHIVELEPTNNNNKNNTSSISRNASSRRKSQPNPSDKVNHVVADVHRPNSQALVITEQEYTKDGEPDEDSETPSNRSSRAGDSSDRTIRSEPYTNRPAQLGSSSPRKRLHRGACDSLISTSSTDDLDEDDVVDYATVDLRKTIRVSSTDGQRTLRKSNDESREHNTIPKSQSFPVKSKHHQQISDSLRLHYVTQRVLASVLPRRDPQDPSVNRPHSEEHGVLPDKYEKEVISMLKQKHGMNYRVFDLESCISVVTLERICELCKHIDKWLNSGQDKVVVLQDRGDRQRLGAAIAAYLEYLDICASNFTTRSGASNEDLRAQKTIARNWLALDVFSMKKFLEDFIGPLRIPSHKRYLKYFSGLLSGRIKMNSSPLFLKFITVESPPSWLHYSRYSSQNEWSSFIKIYEGLRCIYTSDIHIIPITTRQFLYQIGNLRLRGDILIRCYQICPPDNNSYNQESRELLCSVQFHTCAITSSEVSFPKDELDFAHDDPRFPKDHKVTLHFHSGAVTDNGFVFQSPLIRTEPANELARADSIENLNLSSSCHTQGPLDGSLYATILKSPKSPSPPQKTTNYNTTSQRNSFTQNLISPPPQFSNKQFEVVERRPVTSTPIRNSVDSNNRRETSTTSILRSPSQPRSDYSYIESRPGTSQSNYRTQNSYPSGSQQVTIVETYHTNETGHNQNYQNGGRESVRSPLTLSMDSGISSSGVLNRPQQGSSVSPSSFPSQASPQEDRHRELDDILSDMLMTVQDIPDFSKGYSKQTNQKIVRSQSVIPSSSSSVNYVLPVQNQNYSRDTATRSQSCIPHGHETGSSYLTKERDHYDTSSTTTLTPPPSESGRDTPVAGGYTSNSSNISTMQHRQVLYRDKREVYTTNTTSNNSTIMDQQHQSSVYPQPVRTDAVSVPGASEDEENIPYHAREHSQPFTYGNVPLNGQSELVESNTTDPRMIKMQSGLSSPSLVRKTIGTSQTLRKTSPRNDFEEMLRERREKVMSEKYSISDKTSASGFDKTYDRYYSTESWNKGQPNGYHYYNEPLKRSNTLDGFHRSTSSDGLSGQTWLQLQQQKLRAKKGQQYAADRKYFDEVIHTEIRNRPLRTRPVQRYDGYASDTAAFGDEVDYRRPLHVQTPSRSPERTFHTVTTTTTVTKERPFVAVKRAHEQARQERIGSPPLSPLSVLNASPNGQIAQAQNGLLSMADSPRSGQVRLEPDNMTIIQADNNSLACTNVNNYKNIINNNHDNNTINGTDHNNHHNINLIHHKIETNAHPIDNPKDDTTNLTSIAACGQLALDKLLASLAAETVLMEQQLAQTNGNHKENEIITTTNNNNNNNDLVKDIETVELRRARYAAHNDNFNKINGESNTSQNQSKADQELMDVIADLIDYTTFDGLRQMSFNNGCSDSLSNNSNSNSNSSSNGIHRRLASEHENSSSISPSLSERSNFALWHDQTREESFSSYRSETDPELSIAGSPRPETPAFPVTPRTPYGLSSNGSVSPALPPKSPTSQRRLYNSTWSLRSQKYSTSTLDTSKDLYTGAQKNQLHEIINQNDVISYTTRRNSNASTSNSEPQEVAPHHVKFVRDSSKYWYKPTISREEAVGLLRNATPGTFIVRDSTTFKNAFGLVVRVSHPPPGVTSAGQSGDELVRHFLVEPTTRGVRLKGCANEPVFTSLSALVYQHSITPLALPCRLIIPDRDIQAVDQTPAQKQLLAQGAACNVFYLYACDTESLTGEEAVRKAVSQLYSSKPLPTPTEVHFKVSLQGITLTDVTRQKFFRKHYTANAISFCGLDPERRVWSVKSTDGDVPVNNKTIFAFVARRSASSSDNQCHVFCDLSPNQPATAIVSFANKTLPTEKIITTDHI